MPTAVEHFIQSLWDLLKHALVGYSEGFKEDLWTCDSVLSLKQRGNVKDMEKRCQTTLKLMISHFICSIFLFLRVFSCPSDTSNTYLDLSENSK